MRRGRTKVARFVAITGLLAALPLASAGVAQAAMAGANPATTTLRPDLRSVHVLTGLNAGRAQFCFDKALNNTGPAGANYRLGGYRWDTMDAGIGTSVLDSNNQCVDVLMGTDHSGSSPNLNSYTFGQVSTGAVTAAISGGQVNLDDSTANVDSNTHNGTAGHTTGPDLTSVTVGAPAGTNEMIYTFDEPVETNAADLVAGGFGYVNAAGNTRTGAVITGVDSVGDVRVAFGAFNTTEAVNAFVFRAAVNSQGAARSDNPNPETYNPIMNVAVPGSSGISAAPGLSAAVIQGTNQIAYTFDQNVACFISCNAVNAAQFRAVTSNGDEITANSITVEADGKTVLATFNTPNITNLLEEVTVASVSTFAVVNPNNSLTNAPGGKPVGGNAGAFGTGFTNAPDATSVTFNSSSGQAVVNFDQRVAANAAGQPVRPDGTTPTLLTDWRLLDSLGNFIATPTTATVEPLGPYLSDVRLTFSTPTLLGAAKSLMVCGNNSSSGTDPYAGTNGTSPAFCPTVNESATYTFGTPHAAGAPGMNPAGNVQQILAPAASGASVRAGRTHVTLRRVRITNADHKKAVTRKHHRSKHHR